MLDLLAGFDFATNQFHQQEVEAEEAKDVVSQNHQSDDDSSYVYSDEEDEEAKERVRPPREDGKTVSSYDSSRDQIPRGWVRQTAPDFGGSFKLEYLKEIAIAEASSNPGDIDDVTGSFGQMLDELVDLIIEDVHVHILANW